MYVLDVIALSPSSPAAPLSYRSKEKLAPGTIVAIQLRKTPVRGIVVSATEVKDAKAMLKTATFALAKSVTMTDGAMPAPLMRVAEDVAAYHAVPLGAVLHALLSDPMSIDIPKTLPKGPGYELRTFEFPLRTRLNKYRNVIEEQLKDKRSTILVAPTIAELNTLKQEFADLDPIVLSSDVKPEVRRELLVTASSHRGLLITTPTYSFTQVRDLGALIIDRISAGSYRMPSRLFLDRAYALRSLARERELELCIGDFPLPLEYRPGPTEALSVAPAGEIEAVDVRTVREQGEAWKAIPDSTVAEIRKALEGRGRVVVLAARKGYAPSVVCRDCGTSLRDERGRAYSLATIGGKRVLRTADGKNIESAETFCPVCGSWNLMPLGVGAERVAEELSSALPDMQINRFDADTVKTDVQARKVMKQMRENAGLLVGTEAMLPWLTLGLPGKNPYDLAVVASMDSLLALPFWRARERFVRVGLMLQEHAARAIVHTRIPDDTALSALSSPKDTGFYKEEDELRRALRYPPYGSLIAFHAEGSRKRLLETKVSIIEAVMPHVPVVLPERLVEKQTYRLTVLLHLDKGSWPDEELSRRIQALPPFIRVAVDPETFW